MPEPATAQSRSAGRLERPVVGLAPERVRFATPAILTFEGYVERFDVSVLNLSTHGVACQGPEGLAVGDRVHLTFRLNLAANPLTFPCDVLWSQPCERGEANYGLRFGELEPALQLSVRETVRERSEGRAAAWPMPTNPVPSPVLAAVPAAAAPTWSGRPEAAAGAAAMPAAAAAPLRTPPISQAAPHRAGRSLAARALWAAVVGLLVGASGATMLLLLRPTWIQALWASPASQPPARPASGRPPALDFAAELNAPRAEILLPELRVAELVPLVPADPSAPRRRHVGQVLLEESPDLIAITLVADGPVTRHELHWLRHPSRAVVELPGRHSGLERQAFELGNSLLQRLRVGQHGEVVRFVLDTASDLSPVVASSYRDNTVRLEFRRRP